MTESKEDKKPAKKTRKKRTTKKKVAKTQRKNAADVSAESYERRKDAVARAGRARSASARDIGPIPEPANPERKEACRFNLELFCVEYFPNVFSAPFSDDHKRFIKTAERTILKGGKFVEAVFRGFGKSTIAEVAVLWAALYGHKVFLPLIGSSSDAAAKSMGSIKTELEQNDKLAADFPEVCAPIRALEGITLRAQGQTYTLKNGDHKNTEIRWTADEVVLPTIEDSPASGVIIVVYGIESRKARGLRFKRADGRQVRPDFVFIDDPQTDETARNPLQVSKILSTINKSILMSAGHSKPMSALVACTVIEQDDVADRLLDHARNPSWVGHRVPMMRKFADAHETLWLTDYADIRKTYTPGDVDDKARAEQQATDFYAARRGEMDAGAVATWRDCYARDTEISAIQHAYNLLIDFGSEVFASECQNEPLTQADDPEQITMDALQNRVKRISRYMVPAALSEIVAAVDVHDDALFYTVCAVHSERFTIHVLDYGVSPAQAGRLFTLGRIKTSLTAKYPGLGREAAIRRGLEELLADLCGRGYPCEDESELRASKILVDSGYEQDLVFETIAEYGNPIVSPSKGFGIRVTSRPFLERLRDKTLREVLGTNGTTYREKNCGTHRQVRLVHYDANFAKTFLKNRIQTEPGAPGAFSVFGGSRVIHDLFFQHLTAEVAIPTEGNGREITEWKNPQRRDNHWLDCLAYCCVAASVTGCKVDGQDGQTIGRGKKRIRGSRGSFAAKQREKKGLGK